MLDNRKNSGIFDLGTSIPISFQDVGNLIAEKYKVPIEYIPFPEHLRGRYQEFTKAKNEGWPVNFRTVKSYVKNGME
jgi:ADP-L-glycero-D-manno-heptose 6-epimerase